MSQEIVSSGTLNPTHSLKRLSVFCILIFVSLFISLTPSVLLYRHGISFLLVNVMYHQRTMYILFDFIYGSLVVIYFSVYYVIRFVRITFCF